MKTLKTVNTRITRYNIDDIFLKRWSPRTMSGQSINQDELMTLFEAARWAPSSNNNQPWRFIYAMRLSKYFNVFLSLLNQGNRIWCQNAAALIVVISNTVSNYKNKPIITHSLDTGAAWENIALQGTMMGLIIHGIGGFDHKTARQKLKIPKQYNIEMMIAVGKPKDKKDHSQQKQQKEIPSDRQKLEKIVFEGIFNPKGF